ncbi:MAG: F0F1 ATP synthase subunit gamma [Pseudomonadota bacterium]|nr:F0F1 ATP synthase subunit gamma [Pseudomonadota bacterium]
MTETVMSMQHKILSAGELKSVVRTMKGMAASNIRQYEGAVDSLEDYFWTVRLGLAACLRETVLLTDSVKTIQKEIGATGVIVFGSDQGLVGQFNDVMVDYVVNSLPNFQGNKILWAVGERMDSRLADIGLKPERRYNLPNSISAVTRFVGQLLADLEKDREKGEITQVYIVHNQPVSGEKYRPTSQRLLPLDEEWRRNLVSIRWPTGNLPEVVNAREQTLLAFVREYLFVSLFRACVESLASENSSRLAAMQRAEKNIDELLEDLHRAFYRIRQSGIDEELFDVISGFESMTDLG